MLAIKVIDDLDTETAKSDADECRGFTDPSDWLLDFMPDADADAIRAALAAKAQGK